MIEFGHYRLHPNDAVPNFDIYQTKISHPISNPFLALGNKIDLHANQ